LKSCRERRTESIKPEKAVIAMIDSIIYIPVEMFFKVTDKVAIQRINKWNLSFKGEEWLKGT